MHERGVEFPINDKLAVDYYRKASNDPFAQANLADYYMRANDVPSAQKLYLSASQHNVYAMYRSGELYIEQGQCIIGKQSNRNLLTLSH